MRNNKLRLIFLISYPIYLDISTEEDVNLIAAIVTLCKSTRLGEIILYAIV
jgi:hypothetical protein